MSYSSAMSAPDPTLHIDELAARGGVSRRTVRFYVQRGLLDGPTGAGRGATYSEAHLERLIRIRDLQAAGVSLTEIEARLSAPAEASRPPQRPSVRAQSTWVFELAPGVSLHVAADALSPATAAALAERCAALFTTPPTERP